MQFICNAAPKAVPCVRISTTDDQGRMLKKPMKVFKAVRNGDSIFSWIDKCSRKHFTAVDAEAKKLMETDYKAMLDEMNTLLKPHGKKVPKGTPFSVLAESLAKIEYDSKQAKKAERPQLLVVPKVVAKAPEPPKAVLAQPSPTTIAEADEKKSLKQTILGKGGKCSNFDSLIRLKIINAKLEGRTEIVKALEAQEKEAKAAAKKAKAAAKKAKAAAKKAKAAAKKAKAANGK